MNFVSVFDQLRNVTMKAPGCPTPVLQAAYVTAFRDWCAQTQWLRANVTGSTTANSALYTLGVDARLEAIGVFAAQGSQNPGNGLQYWWLGVSNSGGWDPNMPAAMPVRYTYVPEGQIAFNPTPNGVYGMLMTVIVQPLDNVSEIPADPLRKYSSVFEAGALEYLLSMKDDAPWNNPSEAARQGRIFQAGISNGKAEVQRNFNTGSQRVRPRAFI